MGCGNGSGANWQRQIDNGSRWRFEFGPESYEGPSLERIIARIKERSDRPLQDWSIACKPGGDSWRATYTPHDSPAART